MLKEEIMGLFSKLVGSSPGIEKQLEDLYIPIVQTMMGIPSSQAKSFFRDMLTQVKKESLKEGTANLPQHFGDVLLEKESTDEKTCHCNGKMSSLSQSESVIPCYPYFKWWKLPYQVGSQVLKRALSLRSPALSHLTAPTGLALVAGSFCHV
jgi:hypothetical protein